MLNIQENVLLAPYTTLGVGGRADFFLVVTNEDELREGVRFAKERELPISIMGGGSNVLVRDSGVRGLVIKNQILGISYSEEGESVFVTAGGGIIWDDLVFDTVNKGYWGLENLSAIPGTVGATPVQNVGAYGVEVGDLISEVRAYDLTSDKFVNLSRTDCRFGYRDSFFKTETGRWMFIVSVTYKLSLIPAPKTHYQDLVSRFGSDVASPTLDEVRNTVIAIRSCKFPDVKVIGTAGSFFKNPKISKQEADDLVVDYPSLPVFPQSDGSVKVSLGFILDKICGLRGHREGNVGLYDKQALVLVNYGGATEKEIVAFANDVARKVFDKTKIKIEWEVNFF